MWSKILLIIGRFKPDFIFFLYKLPHPKVLGTQIGDWHSIPEWQDDFEI
jgi:hypothetical protein